MEVSCDTCGAPSAALRCSGCQQAMYCSKACQKRAWKKHKPQCKPPSELEVVTIPADCSTQQTRTAAECNTRANAMVNAARTRSEYAQAAHQYRSGIDLMPADDQTGLRGSLLLNEAGALIRAGEYSSAADSCRAGLDCSGLAAGTQKGLREKLDQTVAGCLVLRGKVRDVKPIKVEKLIRKHDYAEVLSFIESNKLVEMAAARGSLEIVELFVGETGASVDGLHKQCPDSWDMIRRGRGYNGCTPLYAAAQGDPEKDAEAGGFGASELFTTIAQYLLDQGADPMAANDGGITPLFIACVNCRVGIVRAMIKTGKSDVSAAIRDGNTPLLLAQGCLEQGFQQYAPLVTLLEAGLAKQGHHSDRVSESIRAALTAKEAGNTDFREGEYEIAIACYSRGIDLLVSVAEPDTKARALLANLHANSAAAALKISATRYAERACQKALEIDPGHAKALARLKIAQVGTGQYDQLKLEFDDAMKLFRVAACNVEGTDGADSKLFQPALDAAARAAELTLGKDILLYAVALSSKTEMQLHMALVSREREHLNATVELANDLLRLCHAYERKPLETTNTVDLSTEERTSCTAMNVVSARLMGLCGTAWLVLARCDNDLYGLQKQAETKLFETFRAYNSALPHLDVHKDDSWYSVFLSMAAAKELMVEVLALQHKWDEACAEAKQLCDHLDDIEESPDMCKLCDYKVLAAQHLYSGEVPPAASELALAMLSQVASKHNSLGDTLNRAKALRKVVNLQRRIGRPTTQMPQLIECIRSLGRSVDDCAICLEPLSPESIESPLDVLNCLHCYHVACIREHVKTNSQLHESLDQQLFDRGQLRDAPAAQLANGPEYLMETNCPECRDTIQMVAHVR